MSGVAQPLSGKTAYIPVPDGLFPFEVGIFALFGTIFLVASVFHFRLVLKPPPADRVRIVREV